MRKLKSLLFTAGIATVLAIGVGAGVTTSNRDAIRANATASTIDLTADDIFTAYGLTNNDGDGTKLEKNAPKSLADSGITMCVTGDVQKYPQVRFYGGDVKFAAPEGKFFTKFTYTFDSKKNRFAGISSTNGKWKTISGGYETIEQTKPTDFTLSITSQVRLITCSIGLDDLEIAEPVYPTEMNVVLDRNKANIGENISVNAALTGSDGINVKPEFKLDKPDFANLKVENNGLGATITPLKAGNVTLTVSVSKSAEEKITKSFKLLFTKEFIYNDKNTYTLVTNMSQLQEGTKFIIACVGKNKIAGNLSGAYLSTVDCKFPTNVKSFSDIPQGAAEFTLGKNENKYTMSFDDGSLLSCTGEKTLSKVSETGTLWNISIASSGISTISTSDSRYTLKYNQQNPRFTAYKSGQSAINIFAKTEGHVMTNLEKFVQEYIYKGFDYETNKVDTGACRGTNGLYAIAKKAFFHTEDLKYALDAAERKTFMTDSANFREPKARFEAWAAANNEIIEFVGNDYVAKSSYSISFGQNDYIVVVIVSVAILSISAIAMFAISKRRKIAR